ADTIYLDFPHLSLSFSPPRKRVPASAFLILPFALLSPPRLFSVSPRLPAIGFAFRRGGRVVPILPMPRA
ncbi:MAG: hypothetical protein ACERK9_11095, partial [Deltaproteobacteria bacterium]